MKKYKSVQVLVATMNQTNNQLFSKMNLQSDAIFGNQIKGKNEIIEESIEGYNVKWLNFSEQGVGLNRNNALMRSDADIVIFADDDMEFYDGYADSVLNIFNENPKADLVIFNIDDENNSRNRFIKKKYIKKCGYGTARIACKREVLFKYGIFFNLNFGGGAKYSYGEDSLFLCSCLRHKLKMLCVPISIAKLNDDRESTWFMGYTDKFYRDRGYLLAAMRVKFPYLRGIKMVLTDNDIEKSKRKYVAELIFSGIRDYYREKL